MTRSEILAAAEEATGGHRTTDYGTPESNFGRIARLWSDYLGHDITAVDVAMLMTLLKVARVKSNHGGIDSYIDIAGYAACAGEIATAQE